MDHRGGLQIVLRVDIPVEYLKQLPQLRLACESPTLQDSIDLCLNFYRIHGISNAEIISDSSR
jgi:hypothetical protein